jgi:hypothetical protein
MKGNHPPFKFDAFCTHQSLILLLMPKFRILSNNLLEQSHYHLGFRVEHIE